MSLQINIDKILNSSSNIFYKIIDKVAVNSLSNARKEASLEYGLNTILIDAIQFSVAQLESEESLVSQLLYNNFGIGENNNKRRIELIMLGGQLKSVIREVEIKKKKLDFHERNVLSSIENLTRLSTAFGKKLYQLEDEEMKIDCERYLKELYLNIDEADGYIKKFKLKSIYLESCLFKYNELLKNIPRYHELREEGRGYILSN